MDPDVREEDPVQWIMHITDGHGSSSCIYPCHKMARSTEI